MDFVAVNAVISEFYICKCRIRRWVVNWMVSETRFIDLETFIILYILYIYYIYIIYIIYILYIYIIYIYIEGKQPWPVMSSDVSQSSSFLAEIWGHREHRQSESSKRCGFVPPGTCCVPMRLRMKQIRSSPSQWDPMSLWNLQDTGKVTVRWKSPCEHPKASRKTWHKTWVEGATSCAFVHQWTCTIDHTSVICHLSNSHNQGGPNCPCLWRELPCLFHAILSIRNHLK